MDENAKKLLDEARQASSADKARARQLLNKVLETYGNDNEICYHAWWYLSHIEETTEGRLEHVKKILTVYPKLDSVLKRLEQLKATLIQDVTKAIDAKDSAKARGLLTKLLDVDEHNEQVWLLFFQVAETDDERIDCLEHALAINPNNPEARGKLEDLKKFTLPPDLEEPVSIFTQLPPETTPEKPPAPALPKERSIRTWNNDGFRNEKDILDDFIRLVDELLEIVKGMEPTPKEQITRLQFSQDKYRKWTHEQLSNIFLVPAVNAATDIAELLLKSDRLQEAFWTANVFGEICKVLIARNPERDQEFFTRLLFVACCAVADTKSAELGRTRTNENTAELNELRNPIGRICLTPALQTYFQRRANEFLRGRIDEVLGEQVLNEALAWYFDKHLDYLLKNDRPQVKGYVSRNMPIVYRLKLSEQWNEKRKGWESRLKNEGQQDVLRDLKDLGGLVNPEEVGELNEEQLADIARADANNDYKRVNELLMESATDLRSFLYSEAQAKFHYREPALPNLKENRFKNQFNKVERLARVGNSDDLQEAIEITKKIWEEDIDNWELQDWLAYLYAKTNNLVAAEQKLDNIRKRRDRRHNFITDWNLAVLAYDRKDESLAYHLLEPLLETGVDDEELITVLLALSYRLGDRQRFLTLVPRTMSQQFLPLAFVVAYELGDEYQQKTFLGQLLKRSGWELPPFGTQFADANTFQKVVNKAIVEDQFDQLVSWLEARIKHAPHWIPNYIELARVLEHRGDINGAFRVLRDRLNQVNRGKDRNQRHVDFACRELLELCKRTKHADLGQQAYKMAKNAKVSENLLRPFEAFAPEPIEGKPPIIETLKPPIIPTPNTFIAVDSGLPERFAWVTAQLTRIQTVAAYIKDKPAIDEFVEIVKQMNPQESSVVVELIQNVTMTIEAFSKNDNRDTRRVLYDRAANFEKRLAQLFEDFEKNPILKRLADVLTPYYGTLKQVMGDLSRQAGVTPNIQPIIENPFISLESDRSTLVLRITNQSERPVTDIVVNLLVDTPVVTIFRDREQKIEKLGPQQSELLNFPIQRNRTFKVDSVNEVVFSVSLRASAEGFKDTIDMGINKLRAQVKTFAQVIGTSQIPKLFQVGQSLRPYVT